MWGQRHSQETTVLGRDHWSKLTLIYTRASLAEPTKSKVGAVCEQRNNAREEDQAS